MENEDSNTVIIQSNIDLIEHDIDLIVMFFESKKQSNGGDTLRSELIDKKLLKLVYESFETKESILKKKYFCFKKYLFKAFDSKISGYKFDFYQAYQNRLIIKDILIDSDFDPDKIDDSVIKMYAEHLSTDNDVLKIEKSYLFDNTFYVTYKDDLDRSQVQSRYNKKPKIRNQQITLFESFNTKSFVIASTIKNSQFNNFEQISVKISEEMQTRGSFDLNYYLIDINDDYIIFQCENQIIFKEMFDLMKIYLKSFKNFLMMEECFNFKLLEFVNRIKKEIPLIKKELKILNHDEQIIQAETVNAQTMTETQNVVENLNDELTDGDKNTKKKNKIVKEAPNKKVEKNEQDLVIEKIKMDNIYLENLFKSQTDNEIVLNEEAPLAIGLINCAQLRADLDKTLESFKTKIYFNKKNKYKMISVKFDKESKNKVINVVKNFAKINFLYKIVHLPLSISNDEFIMDALINYVPNLNKQYPGIHLCLNENSIHCYGYPKSLGKVLDTNCGILKDIVEKRNLISHNKKQEEFKEKSLNKTEKENSKNLKSTPKPSIKMKQDLTIESTEIQSTESKNDWKLKAQKSKNDGPAFKDSNKIVLYDSYEPIEEIKLIESELMQNSNFVLIDPKKLNVLSICLMKCHKIALDFINDLKIISPVCQLVFIPDEKNDPIQCGILIGSSDEKYIESYKIQLDKLINYYEKNRLKHIYNLIDDKLKLDEVFPTLISNFQSSKNELNDLKIILEMIYNSTKVLHVQLSDKKLLEIYGYTNAVQNYDSYALDILNKTISSCNNNLNNLLAFKLFQNENPKLSVFFKFDDFYFNDFVSKIEEYVAHVVKIDEQKAIHIACFNKKLRNNPKKLELLEDIRIWRETVEKFIFEYLELFQIETLEMPFKRKSEECKNTLYDKNSLDISWIDDNYLEVIGLKEEIQKFKLRIF